MKESPIYHHNSKKLLIFPSTPPNQLEGLLNKNSPHYETNTTKSPKKKLYRIMRLLRAVNPRLSTKLFLKNGIVEKLERFFLIICFPWNLASPGKQLPISRHLHTTPPLSTVAITRERKEEKRENSSTDLQKWSNGLRLWNHMILMVGSGTNIVAFFSERSRTRPIFRCGCNNLNMGIRDEEHEPITKI